MFQVALFPTTFVMLFCYFCNFYSLLYLTILLHAFLELFLLVKFDVVYMSSDDDNQHIPWQQYFLYSLAIHSRVATATSIVLLLMLIVP